MANIKADDHRSNSLLLFILEWFRMPSLPESQDDIQKDIQDEDEIKDEIKDEIQDKIQDEIQDEFQEEIQDEFQDKAQDDCPVDCQDGIQDDFQDDIFQYFLIKELDIEVRTNLLIFAIDFPRNLISFSLLCVCHFSQNPSTTKS